MAECLHGHGHTYTGNSIALRQQFQRDGWAFMHQRGEGRMRLAQAARFFSRGDMRCLHFARRAANEGQGIGHDIREAHAAALRQGMARTGDEYRRLRAQLFHRKPRVGDKTANIHDADRRFAFQDGGGHFGPIRGYQPHPCGGKGGQHLRRRGQAERLRHIGAGNHIQITGLSAARFR